MSNKVKSRWTVTFDKGGPHELVLCGTGMFLADVISVAGEQVVEDADYIEADDSEPLALGNVKRPQKLTVHETHADREAALEWCFAQDMAMPVGVQAALTVEIEDGATYVYSPCAIQRWNFTPRRGGPHETEATYELKCGALSLGAAAGPDLVGLATAALTVSAGEGTLDAAWDPAANLEAVAAWENQGTGDDAIQATAGQRPQKLAGGGYFLPGIAGNYATASDGAHVDLGANWSILFDATLDDYTPAARSCLVSKWVSAGDQRAWALMLETDGKLTMEWSTNGTAGGVLSYSSTTALPVTNGSRCKIFVLRSGTNLVFYLIAGETQVQIGDAVVVSAAAAANTTAAVNVGASEIGTAALLAGTVHQVQLWTSVASWNSTTATFRWDFTGSFESGPTDGGQTTGYGGSFARSGARPARLLPGGAIAFDGGDDNLAAATAVPLNAVSGATLVWRGLVTRTAGTQDLVWCGTNGADARALLRLNGGVIELHVRRLDAEAAAVLSYTPAAFGSFGLTDTISASIDYAAGTATLYYGASPKSTAVLTSAGVTSATDSSGTRIMAGAAGANPAAGYVKHVHIAEEAFGLEDHINLINSIAAASP